MIKNIHILILAAGASKRMGTAKQLLPWDNTTLLENAIAHAKASKATDVLVVLGSEAARIKDRVLDKDVVFLENREWASGMGSSIVCGINYSLEQKKIIDGILIMLCDQPLIDTAYLNKMIETFIKGEKGIVVTGYDNSSGVPAIFTNSYFPELQKLGSDLGARNIIDKYNKDCIVLDAGHKTPDIDSKADYDLLLKRTGQRH